MRLEDRPSGIGFTNLPLCHGVRPILRLELPGGEAFRDELRKLDDVVQRHLERYASTPYETAVRRLGIARFHPTYPGLGAVVSKRPKSKAKPGPETETSDRPTRPGRNGGSRTGTGTTTGGGG